jgi:NAD(P)-dependent dehydrogenase (short-subunit alcohol dehydrogenase family)
MGRAGTAQMAHPAPTLPRCYHPQRMSTVLVTGANRGLGLEFVRQYAALGWNVLAGCRDPATADDLRRTASGRQVQILAIDVRDGASVAAAAIASRHEPVDVLLNVAGVMGGTESTGQIDYDAWLEVLDVNTLGPLRVLEAFMPNLLLGGRKLAVAITSRMGSIGENGSSGYTPYRSSKAALNMAMKNASLDLASKGITCVVMHPGWVKTDMGGPNATLEPRDSIASMIRTLEGLTAAANGRFLNYDGRDCQW